MSAITLKSLRKTYSNDVVALKGIDLTVERGDFFALLGPNGAGKSTIIGIISSLVNKDSGTVEICGINCDENFSEAKTKLGVVNQEFNFSQFESVIDIIVTQAGYYGIDFKTATARAEKHLKRLALWDKRNDQARMLSGGQKRRIMIIKALIHEPDLLILDEPTAGVDIELRRSLWDFLLEINNEGTTIILTTHYLEEAENLCRNIAIIDNGEIIKNTTMNSLLKQMDDQDFVIETSEKLPTNFSLKNFKTEVIDENKFSLTLSKDSYMNDLFNDREISHLKIKNIRNQTNRLEELFIKLTTKDE
ncbi:MAG: ABC transporter [Gammaproteobacteria bacterium]|nr:ABC transporter [Gammaproteobacteria bacterium]MBH37220.1 ABC transporter [Gammaproteobacteria bacterium]|tara:strand:- start:5802 stop:6716 length:915 start_codon:yes stop_codon:yes gene_type:complete